MYWNNNRVLLKNFIIFVDLFFLLCLFNFIWIIIVLYDWLYESKIVFKYKKLLKKFNIEYVKISMFMLDILSLFGICWLKCEVLIKISNWFFFFI